MANQEIRQEISFLTQQYSFTTGTDSNQIAQLDTAAYSGTPTYYFEAFAASPGAGGATSTITLRRKGTSTDDATLTFTTPADGSGNLKRSTSFSPPAGATEYIIRMVASTSTGTLNCARIIILQNESTISQTQTQIEIGGRGANTFTNTTVADLNSPKFWTYTSANWDGTIVFSVEVVWKTSASNTTTIRLCRTSDNATNVTVVSAQTNTAFTRTRVTFTPVNGETYKIRGLGSTTKSNWQVACAKIVITQTGTPTKLEPQFLLLDTADSNATGVQSRQTIWDSTEWNAESGSITYKHLMDSDNASNSIVLRDITAAADISSSTLTGTGQQVSAAITFTTGNKLDCWVLNTTGVIAASRIQVIYVYVAPSAAARRIFISKW